jgi:hypothetical protein
MSLGLGSPVAVVGPDGLLVGKVHAVSVAADGTDLVEVEANGKLIPALPASWFVEADR